MPASGLVIIDKPGGITSHGVVAVTRRTLNTRKVGHAGTLDPMATGILVVGIGQATRLLGFLALTDKEYEATIRLGSSTFTDDSQGDVLDRADPADLSGVSDERINDVITRFVGRIEQVPSSVSAIKVDGARAYSRVRAGEEVELKPRAVTVTAFDIVKISRQFDAVDVDVKVACSTGTYIRALARDVGRQLGVGGHLTRLRRTRVGPFSLPMAHDLDSWSFGPHPESAIVPINEIAAAAFTCKVVSPEQAADITYGRRIEWEHSNDESGDVNSPEPGVMALMDESGSLLALAREKDGRASYLCVFVTSTGPA